MFGRRDDQLELLVCPVGAAQTAAQGPVAFGKALKLRLADGVLDEALLLHIADYGYAADADPGLIGWSYWLMKHRREKALVGVAGFGGKPSADGEVEIGVHVAPSYRRQGYAYQSAVVLIGWAFGQPQVEKIAAQFERRNSAALALVQKLRMRLVSEDDGLMRWALLRNREA